MEMVEVGAIVACVYFLTFAFFLFAHCYYAFRMDRYIWRKTWKENKDKSGQEKFAACFEKVWKVSWFNFTGEEKVVVEWGSKCKRCRNIVLILWLIPVILAILVSIWRWLT